LTILTTAGLLYIFSEVDSENQLYF